MALPKAFRLHLEKDFNILFKFGRTYRTNFGLIKYNRKANNHPRCAVVVGKKAVKTSVDRHRIKRLINNAIDQAGFRRGVYDMMIVVQKNISKNNFSDIKNEFVSTRLF